jgi:hypothetical protein
LLTVWLRWTASRSTAAVTPRPSVVRSNCRRFSARTTRTAAATTSHATLALCPSTASPSRTSPSGVDRRCFPVFTPRCWLLAGAVTVTATATATPAVQVSPTLRHH